ncbi:unnamed protein product [Staurois parvus]|uniref:Uncharacterized protein n=1 Tax=Staurois parvus TaxID=386267 RepID=A0ABN9F609_9NEOB|nr:unnamed protein product [Staurois parvus]
MVEQGQTGWVGNREDGMVQGSGQRIVGRAGSGIIGQTRHKGVGRA